MKILLGSNNPNKLQELKNILSALGVEVLLAADVGVHCDVTEDGKSLSENAAKKALAYARASGLPAVADDSGLEVDALGGEPGVRSARYASQTCDYKKNNDKLLERMKSVPDGKPRGSGGFGYDPLFFYPPASKTFAEMLSKEKNSVSHRSRALMKLKEKLENVF